MKRLLIIIMLISSLTLTSCKAKNPEEDIDDINSENTNIENPTDDVEYKPYGGWGA